MRVRMSFLHGNSQRCSRPAALLNTWSLLSANIVSNLGHSPPCSLPTLHCPCNRSQPSVPSVPLFLAMVRSCGPVSALQGPAVVPSTCAPRHHACPGGTAAPLTRAHTPHTPARRRTAAVSTAAVQPCCGRCMARGNCSAFAQVQAGLGAFVWLLNLVALCVPVATLAGWLAKRDHAVRLDSAV